MAGFFTLAVCGVDTTAGHRHDARHAAHGLHHDRPGAAGPIQGDESLVYVHAVAHDPPGVRGYHLGDLAHAGQPTTGHGHEQVTGGVRHLVIHAQGPFDLGPHPHNVGLLGGVFGLLLSPVDTLFGVLGVSVNLGR